MKEIINGRLSAAWLFFLGSVLFLVCIAGFRFFENPIELVSELLDPVRGYVIATTIAGGVTVQQGIAKFSGEPLYTVGTAKLIWTYLSLIASFVLGPVAFIYLRNRIQERKNAGSPNTVSLRIGYWITYAWVVLLPAFIVTTTTVSYSVFSQMKKDNALSRYRDDAMQTLAKIADKSQQFYILPVAEGGGGKSFQKNGAPVTLEDLGFKEKTDMGMYFLYRQKSDTTMYFHFFGNKPGTLTSGGHNPEITHVVEYGGVIYPSRFRIITLN